MNDLWKVYEVILAMNGDGLRWDQHRSIGDGVLSLDAEDLRQLLPIDKDRILLDRIHSLQPGEMAIAQKAVSNGDVHRVGEKNTFVFPSTTAMSALEQLALVVILSESAPASVIPRVWQTTEGQQIPQVLEIETLEVESEMIVPGTLHLRAQQVQKLGDGRGLFEGGVSIGGVDFIRARWVMGKV